MINKQLSIDYIKQHARPLEKSLLGYYFNNEQSTSVIKELSKFQNEDGGFGKALEPDVRLTDSSVLATTIAFQKFRELNIPASEEIVQKACRYILNTYDNTNKIWLNVPANVDDASHATWWNYNGDPEKFLGNPRVEIVAYFYDYPDLFPENLKQGLTIELLSHLNSLNGSIEMHDLLCYTRLVETKNLPIDIKNKMVEILKPLVISTVASNPSDWNNYGLTPLTIITSPESMFYPELKSLVPANLEYLSKNQTTEGYWSPSWNWESVSKEDWAKAEKDLRGIITLNNLILFQNFEEKNGSKN